MFVNGGFLGEETRTRGSRVYLSPSVILHSQFFLLNVLGLHWLIKLYRFQVYDSIIHHQYRTVCSPPQVISFHHHLCPYTVSYFPHPSFPLVITTLLSMAMRFCSLLNPFTFFTQLPTFSRLTAVSLFSVSMSLFLFCLFVLFIRFHI